MSGKVYLVGAGPGKPDLITVRGQNILKEADVIVYDYLVDQSLLENAGPDAELISCGSLRESAGTKDPLARQEKITSILVEKALENKKVVRLKCGDPLMFSRSSHELEALTSEGIEFEVVPGITAAGAASSFSGIPLTDRGLSSDCVFVTGNEDPGKKDSLIDWESLAGIGTVVFYMAVRNLGDIAQNLIKAGKDKKTPVAIVQNASLPEQKVIIGSLDNIADLAAGAGVKPPAVIIIGKVAELGRKYNWTEKNRRVLFTGLSDERYFLNGTYVYLPLIKIIAMENYTEFDDHIRKIKEFDWIVFTSRYGVFYFFQRMDELGFDSRALGSLKIAAVGRSTGRSLKEHGIIPDLVPENESASGLVEEFSKIDINGKKIFLPRSDISDKGINSKLVDLGAQVTSGCAYRNVMQEHLPDLDLEGYDEFMFTSPSTVRNFKKRYKKVPAGAKVSCIGDITLKEAKRCLL